WVVSNLPYNISVPLTLKFLSTPSLEKMTLMMQKEVAERIFPEGKKALKSMNSLMALCQTFFSVEKLCPVPPGAFLPPPKVNSTVLSFVRKKAPAFSLSDIPKLEAFFQRLFLQKRKQLGKVLKMNFDANKVEKVLQEQNIDPQRRSETLTLDEVHELFKNLP
ncbi:MAG: rRNA adenine dimethyltransferase family protein, partial [Bdellovibrionota bacterium]|nr:rRNA adenine dimethyltransferase family protein [Bdellovibrionota bacterium]